MKKKFKFTVEEDDSRDQWEIWATCEKEPNREDISAFFSQHFFSKKDVEWIARSLARKCQ